MVLCSVRVGATLFVAPALKFSTSLEVTEVSMYTPMRAVQDLLGVPPWLWV